MSKQVILTGLRANNDLHIGHVFGAMRPIIEMAANRSDEFQVNMFIPDLHSFTTPIDHSQLQAQIMHNIRLFVAAGLPLDNDSINLYRQSYIPAHSELTIILNSFTGMGEMGRMTQFKDKQEKLSRNVIDSGEISVVGNADSDRARMLASVASTRISVGLFDYPVLMAADILLYGASYVPVGDDQSQHLEFTRDIAERMNNKFGDDLFVVPKSVKKQHAFFGKEQGLRILDLVDPTKKMSKSDETGKGVIFLGDAPELAAKKIMSATTDDLALIAKNHEHQPGITNLLELYEQLGGDSTEFIGQTQYGAFKKAVADKVVVFLTEFQARVAAVDDTEIRAKLAASEKAMNEQAQARLLRVQQAIGLRDVKQQ